MKLLPGSMSFALLVVSLLLALAGFASGSRPLPVLKGPKQIQQSTDGTTWTNCAATVNYEHDVSAGQLYSGADEDLEWWEWVKNGVHYRIIKDDVPAKPAKVFQQCYTEVKSVTIKVVSGNLKWAKGH